MSELIQAALTLAALPLLSGLTWRHRAVRRQGVGRAGQWPTLILVLLAGHGPMAAAEENCLILVADPQLEGSVFQRSVVLVTRHGNGGVLGVIINRVIPLDPAMLFPGDDLLRDIGEVQYGGPVSPATLVFLFRSPDRPANALHLFDDVYMSNDRELLAEQKRRPRVESGLQVYAGYAGWAPGQLRAEMMRGSWSTMEADAELIFNTDRESIWEKLAREQVENWI